MRLRLLSALVVLLAYGALHYTWLPADGFFSGDSGTKYLQARAVVEQGPLTPWIEGPALDLDPTLRWREPFMLPVNGHLVGIFPWLFALATAPFLWLFGLPGLYVLPALSMVVVFLATAAIGRALGQPAGGAWSGWLAVLATPLLFYGAEMWEHAPAAALSTTAIALLMEDSQATRTRALLAGVCGVLAFGMRPEALVVVPALLLARAWVVGPRVAVRDAASIVTGVLVAGAAVAAMTVIIHGAAVSPQVSLNFGAGSSYFGMRREALLSLLLPPSQPALFLAGLAISLAGAFPRADRARFACLYTGMALMLIAGVGAPVWRAHAERIPWLGSFDGRSLANTWPLVLVPCCYAAVRSASPAERTLVWATILTLVLVFFTLPHLGGAQWSARFFLPAAPLAAVLAVERLRDSRTRGLTTLIVVASVALQISSLTFLRQAKRVNAQITRTAASLTRPGDVIVSDAFWYPEVTATLYPSRRLLFAWSPADFDAVATAVADHGLDGFWIAAVTPTTGYAPPDSFSAGAGRPPFVRTRTRDAGISSLVFHHYERR